MFSQIVTAAKGLFTRQELNENRPKKSNSTPSTPSKSAIDNKSKMVTATRRRSFLPTEVAAESPINEQKETGGKRKTRNANSGSTDSPGNKRRKETSDESAQEVDSDSQNTVEKTTEESKPTEEEQPVSTKKNHFRFDSEEPEVPLEIQAEEKSETQQEPEEDSSDDDDAPEAVDNSAQLAKIKSEAKKLEKARQIEEHLRREKRKQLDDLRKSQAKTSNKRKADDLLSESTETLQGSVTQDTRRSALPALLPDDILNAAPVARPLTPPAEETDIVQKKPNKLRFLDKTDKRAKDVRMGDVTIRVLDEEGPKKKSKTSLPPKASKAGRSAKEGWLNKARSTGHVNGLRRTTGGSSGFVRK